MLLTSERLNGARLGVNILAAGGRVGPVRAGRVAERRVLTATNLRCR